MQRQITDQLQTWKNSPDRKPLLLRGVRQSGKTWILRQFGSDHFTDTAYFNFEETPALHPIFRTDLNPHRILTELGLLRGNPILPGTTLLILDEIQFCPEALASLKYFAENLPEQHIACAGSLLGIALAKPLSFPVGKVEILTLRPMNFPEFLLANNKKHLLDYLTALSAQEPLPQSIIPQLSTLYQEYLITGGMPEAVNDWIAHHDSTRIEKIHKQILQSYTLDFAKHAPRNDFPKLTLIWDAIPRQLAKENSKFVFGHVKTGARAKDLEDAVQWLVDAGLVYKVERIERPGIPLAACADSAYFKLYFADVGLFRTHAGLPAEALLTRTPYTAEIRGALTENYVLTELVARDVSPVCFWRSGNRAEVDFVVQQGVSVLPLEVKAAENTRSKSLARYQELFSPELAVKVSLADLRYSRSERGSLLSIPLFLVWMLPEFAGELL